MKTEDKFAKMWKKSREDAGKSQQYMAKALGVSRKTIQNWESGFSCPGQLMGFKWFEILDLQPLPYYLELLYGNYENLSTDSKDDKITACLLDLVAGLPENEKRKLMFILHGDHGGSVSGLLELFIAYLHLPLEYRLSIAQSILIDYNIVTAYKKERHHIKPDVDMLDRSIKNGILSVAKQKQSYSNWRDEND